MFNSIARFTLAAAGVLLPVMVHAQATTSPATAPAEPAPKEWIEADTGHRVRRLTDESNSVGFYFNINAYTPDGREMVYSAPDSIRVLNLATLQTTDHLDAGLTVFADATHYCLSDMDASHIAKVVGPGGTVDDTAAAACTSATG